MDAIKRLVKTMDLKTNFLSDIKEKPNLIFHYDDLSDTLILLFISPDQETIVHYLDRNVAILYRPGDLEIVGLQIEDFDSEFVPMYSDLEKVWCLSDFGINDRNVWDLTLEAEQRKLILALQIVKEKEKIIGGSAKEFERVLEYA